MNRTEHRIRMAFDAEYEAKWLEVKEDRKLVRKITIKEMRSRTLIVLSLWCGSMVFWGTRSWAAAFLTPTVIWLIPSASCMWWADRRKRKELGI